MCNHHHTSYIYICIWMCVCVSSCCALTHVNCTNINIIHMSVDRRCIYKYDMLDVRGQSLLNGFARAHNNPRFTNFYFLINCHNNPRRETCVVWDLFAFCRTRNTWVKDLNPWVKMYIGTFDGEQCFLLVSPTTKSLNGLMMTIKQHICSR